MIEKLDSKMEYVELSVFDKKAECLDFEAARKLNSKINELVDAVNELQTKVNKMAQNINFAQPEVNENVQGETPRCPFCGEELSYAQEIDGGFEILTCDCPHGIWLFGNDKMWYNLEKATTELDRTRKALDVAVDALTEYTDEKRWDWERCYELHSAKTAKKALEQITALEQKDVK